MKKLYFILQITIIILSYVTMDDVQFLFFILSVPPGIYFLYKTLIDKERLYSDVPNWFFTIGGFFMIIIGIMMVIEFGN